MPVGEAVQDQFLMGLLWNFIVYFISVGKLWGCNQLGGWGLFWYNDNGEMMNACFKTGPQGANAEYIL